MKKIFTVVAMLFLLAGLAFAKAPTPDLFFSEYVEGSSYNKALEIYNPTGAAVDLANYRIMQSTNGAGWQYVHTFPAGATLAAGDVWVICANQINVALFDTLNADEVLAYPSVVHHNGDDARGLVKISGTDTLWLDIIGNPTNDPGTGWPVAGVANGTVDHTLVRKPSITVGNTDWAASFGTNTDDSEWIVYDNNTLSYLGSHTISSVPEVINVTLQFNSSTVLDTLGTNGFVEVRGALNDWKTGAVLPGGKVIDWNTSSDLDMVNVGGDYWSVTFEMYPDDTLRYKFWTGHNSETGTYPGGGWEGPFDNTIADSRILITAQSDTVVPVQYYNPDLGLGPQPQYKKPFVPKPDTLAIYFRVNMGGEMEAERFDPNVNGPIGMRGDGGASGGVLDWDVTKVKLTWEENSVYDGSFWSGVAYFDKDSVEAGVQQSFKFYAENTPNFSWEDGNDHKFTYPVALKDSTIYWTWFSGKKIAGVAPIEAIVTWRLSTEALEALGLFNRGVGDQIEIRGPHGWDAVDAVVLYYQPLLQEWTSANESFKLPPGTEIFYKYFIDWDSSRFDINSPNYIAGLTNTDGTTRGWEEPAITGGGNRTHVFQNAAEQTAVGDFGFERQFFNSVPANGVFNNDLTVTWNVNMSNAANPDSNAANASNLFRPGTDSVFVQWDGELLAVTQGQDMWGGRFLELKDPDGDMVYSGSYTIKVSLKFPNGWYQLGYKIAYSTSEAGVYIVNTGGGVELGRRYMQYIHPDHIHPGTPWPQTVWPTSYTLPVVPWRDTNL
ncbi:MAG TPA: lamin tail domain-containing protein, partial [bacterium]